MTPPRHLASALAATSLVLLSTGAPALAAPRPRAAATTHATHAAHEVPARQHLVLSARHTAVTTITLPRVALDWSRLRIDGPAHDVAVYLEPLDRDGHDGSGVLVAPSDGQTTSNAPARALRAEDFFAEQGDGPREGRRGWLAPGRYRVHLATDGPVTVSFPAFGLGRTRVLSLHRPGHDAFAVRDVAVTSTPAHHVGRARAPLDQPPRAFSLAVSLVTLRSSTPVGSDVYEACLVPVPHDGGDCSHAASSSSGSEEYTQTVESDPTRPSTTTAVSTTYYDASTHRHSHLLGHVDTTDDVVSAVAVGLVLATHP